MRSKLLSLFVLVAAGGYLAGYLRPDPARVVFLSVGQGDSALLHVSGVDILVDAGPAREEYDAGEALVVPKLRELGVSRLSLLFLTHPDGDHIGGAGSVLRRYPSARVVLNAAFRSHPDVVAALRKWELPSSRVIWVKDESRWTIGDASLTCLAPEVALDDNEGSLILRFQVRGAKAVLSGDATADSEDRTARLDDWSADVMSAGHHGSRTAASLSWVREVHPRYAAISCGIDNSYGHPHRETISLLDQAGVEVHRTDKEGDLPFVERNGRFVFDR